MPSLGNDLAAIRKELNMSLEDIHKATKIPIHILDAIEDDSIFTHFEENITYIRSYVRSYAKALKIDDKLIVRALNQVQKGTYSGLIREGSSGEVRPKFQYDSQEFESDEEEDDGEDMIHDHVPAGTRESPKSQPDQPSSKSKHSPPNPPSVRSIDWADMGQRFSPLRAPSKIWIGVVILVIAILGITGVIYFQNTGPLSQESNPATQPRAGADALGSDSLQLNLTAPSDTNNIRQRSATPAESLSDTLKMVIYAAYGRLEPVRVYSDVMDSLNPYWIEQGEALRFDFVNIIRIRGQYSRMVLMLNGHVLEDFRQRFLDAQSGMLEINREVFEGDPKWLQPAPDSLGIDAPPPAAIKERPIFN